MGYLVVLNDPASCPLSVVLRLFAVALFLPVDLCPVAPSAFREVSAGSLEKIHVKFRVAGALALHSLMWFFFVYEVVFCAWFFEKFILIGIFVCHAYVARPVEN